MNIVKPVMTLIVSYFIAGNVNAQTLELAVEQ